jgi:hypothetical protein
MGSQPIFFAARRLDFIARLAALVPRPRVNLTRYLAGGIVETNIGLLITSRQNSTNSSIIQSE